MQGRVLLVEDDASLQESTKLLLERAGMEVTVAGDGQAGIDKFRSDPFDLMVLDIMLPALDGLEVCRLVRKESNIPIIMLTALDAKTDLVVGLEIGADDYITKPFDGHELIARTRAVLRRSTGEPHAALLKAGELEIDPDAFRVTKEGRILDLSATEFKLLLELARHAGQVLTRESLLRRVWDYEYMGDSRMVDMAIKRLRLKVEDPESQHSYIATVRGVGYRFDKP